MISLIDKKDKDFYAMHKKQLNCLYDAIQKSIICYAQRFSFVKYKTFCFDAPTYILGLADTIGYSTITNIPEFFDDPAVIKDVLIFCGHVFYPFFSEVFNSGATKDTKQVMDFCNEAATNYLDIACKREKVKPTPYDMYLLGLGKINIVDYVYLSRLLNGAFSCRYSTIKDQKILDEIYDVLTGILDQEIIE